MPEHLENRSTTSQLSEIGQDFDIWNYHRVGPDLHVQQTFNHQMTINHQIPRTQTTEVEIVFIRSKSQLPIATEKKSFNITHLPIQIVWYVRATCKDGPFLRQFWSDALPGSTSDSSLSQNTVMQTLQLQFTASSSSSPACTTSA